MEMLVIAISVIFVMVLLRYYLLLNGIKQIRKQIKDIHEADGTNQQVTNPYSFSELSKLVREMNVVLALSRENFIYFRRAEQEIKEQITNISHDLRTPLASILGFFELIEDACVTDEEKEQYLNTIKRRAELLRNLLDNYYDLAQIESEKRELQMNRVNVGELLIDVLAIFYYDFTDKEIVVDIIGELEHFQVLADKELLQRVFVNLVQNVLKHGHERCEIIHESRENQVYTIIKNKIAIGNQVEIKKVFNRLYSADKTRNLGNTGIGLTIAKLLIEKMGHDVQAELTDDNWFLIKINWQI